MLYKNLFIAFLLNIFIFSSIIANNDQQINLMPVPRDIRFEEGKFRLNSDFKIGLQKHVSDRLNKALTRALRRLDGRTGLFFSQDFITAGDAGIAADMQIKAKRYGLFNLDEDESYQLKISEGNIILSAETDIGIIRGLETFLQLLSADEKGYYFPVVVIDDAPRFAWRGLMIDIARHFQPVNIIKHNLDAMAAVKLNVFHWHLVDDQGFRIESKTFPKLHLMSSDGFYYTHEQIKDVINYAQDRGIRVIPEFDVPAHATSWIHAYPELGSAPGPYTMERGWGIKDPTLNPAQEFTYRFLDKFFEEMAALFPDDYMHIGGDENNGKHWDANPEIQQFMKENNIKDNHELQTYFNKRILKILTKHGKKMIGWDEIYQPDLPKNVVIHSWRGHESLNKAAKEGYWGILSNGYYIDLIQPAEFHYLNDPIPEDSPLDEDEKKYILGGEATSWGELVTPETIDSRIWPRTAAIAERLWSPREIRDVDDMYRRMYIISGQLEELGLLHIKNYEMMLRRLTNHNDITALKTFTDVVEPVKIYQRHFQGVKYLQHSPYTRVVDAARPESKTARQFRKLVDQYLQNKDDAVRKEILSWLNKWKKNHTKLAHTAKMSPIIREIMSLSSDLSILAEHGIAALNHIANEKRAAEEWRLKALEVVERAKKPRGQVELMVVSAVEKMIQNINK